MVRAHAKLSAVEVAKAKKPGMYADGGNLYLRIGPTGAKSWIFRFMVSGHSHDMGIGPVHTISLSKARELARVAREARLNGDNPIELRATERRSKRSIKRVSFEECANDYIDARKIGWKASHREQMATNWKNTLAHHAYPIFGSAADDTPDPLPIEAIDRDHVLKVLRPIWENQPVMASELRRRMEKIFAAAKVNKYYKGENPARWKENLEHDLAIPSRVHVIQARAALTNYADIGDVFTVLGDVDRIGGKALQFVILTAMRTDAVRGAEWGEFDIDAMVWTIPAARMKDLGKNFRLPLSHAAIAHLKKVAENRAGNFVFPGRFRGQSMSDATMLQTLKSLEWREPLTTHGFRASFGTWARDADENYREDLIELSLGHKVGNATYEAYMRGDLFNKRRVLMDAWARFVVPDMERPDRAFAI